MAPTSLSLGIHVISYRVQDEEGNWSMEDTMTLLVAEELHTLYIPTIQQ
jgi:hypothetical protein